MKNIFQVIARILWSKQLLKKKPRLSFREEHETPAEAAFPEQMDLELYGKLFWSVFEGLPETCRNLLLLHWKDISNQEISEMLGISEEYIWKRKSICTRRFVNEVKGHSDYYLFASERRIDHTVIMADYAEYINRYISGKMAPEEKSRFLAELQTNGSLEEAYQILLKSREYIKAKSVLKEIQSDPDIGDAIDLVCEFYAEKDQMRREKARKLSRWLIVIPAAAILGFLLVIRGFINTDPEKLFLSFYTPVKQEEFVREIAGGETTTNGFYRVNDYADGYYERALLGLPQALEYSYFRGLCLLGLEDWRRALDELQEYNSEYPELPGPGWYLALVLVHEGNFDKAEDYLNMLAGMENPYQRRARRLLRKIK